MTLFTTTRRYFQDKSMLSLFVAAIVLAAIGIVSTVVRIHSSEFPVPIRYVSDLDRAPWYHLYLFPAFFALSTLAHAVISMRVYSKNPGAAKLIVFYGLLVSLLALRVTSALLSL